MYEFLKELTVGNVLQYTEGMNQTLRLSLGWWSLVLYIVLALIVTTIIATVVGIILLAIGLRTPLRPFIVDKLGLDTVRSLDEYKRRKRNKRK